MLLRSGSGFLHMIQVRGQQHQHQLPNRRHCCFWARVLSGLQVLVGKSLKISNYFWINFSITPDFLNHLEILNSGTGKIRERGSKDKSFPFSFFICLRTRALLCKRLGGDFVVTSVRSQLCGIYWYLR